VAGFGERPRALIVDFGGVLTVAEDGVFAAFCRESGADPERLGAIVAGAFDGSDPNGIVARRERGSLSLEDFERALASALSEGLSRPIDPAGLYRRLFSAERIDDAMMAAIGRLRAAGIRTAMLSNTWGDGEAQDSLSDAFDAMVLSGRLGVRKPEPAIFLAASAALGVEPRACVLVDDVMANVRAAEAVGMHGIHHLRTGATVAELARLFGLMLETAEDPR